MQTHNGDGFMVIGFMIGRFTFINFTLYHHYLIKAVEKDQVDAIYTDFHKAFHSASHSILLSKLSAYGITDILLMWISSFIIGRYQIVRFNNLLPIIIAY